MNACNNENINLSNVSSSSQFTTFSSKDLSFTESTMSDFSEKSATSRFSRFSNPTISYDYKCGNYIGIWEQLYPSLMTSFIEVARGMRKAPWFASEQYADLLTNNYKNFFSKFTNKINLKLQDSEN